MAETADILANRLSGSPAPQRRAGDLSPPDLAAGCSMADMAEIEQVEECWDQLAR